MSEVGAAGVAFIIAVSVNYLLSRRLVFKGSLRSVGGGYLNFMIIAGAGLLLVTAGMFALTSWLGVHYLVARVAIAVVTGFWNYLMNLYVNFKVAGNHVGW
jgi:putative flippase GtrA